MWVNGAYVSNFDSTASFGSDQRMEIYLMEEMYRSWKLLLQWRGSWSCKERDNESVVTKGINPMYDPTKETTT